MKVQPLLCVGALAGMSLIALPVLSQSTPGQQPPRPGGSGSGMSQPTPGGQATGKMQALSQLTGTWQITVKTYAGTSGGSAQATPTSTAQGTSTRTWLFDNKILQEDIRVSPMRSAGAGSTPDEENDGALGYTDPEEREDAQDQPRTSPPPRPGTSPTPPSGTTGGMMGQSFQGHCMFGFDQQSNQFKHVWCDNSDSNITLSTGNYDESSKTFTFNVKDAGMGGGAARPSTPSSTTPGTTTPGSGGVGAQDDDDMPTRPGQPARPGTGGASGSGSMQNVDLSGLDRIVLRVTSDNQHVVEYFKNGNTKIMDVTYSKSR